MTTSPRQWAHALHTLSHRVDTDALADAFMAQVAEKDIGYQLPSILKHLESLAAAERRTKSVRITSSHQLTESVVASITRFVGAHADVPVVTIIDSDVIGGFIAEYDGTVYDASIARQTKRLQASLMSTIL